MKFFDCDDRLKKARWFWFFPLTGLWSFGLIKIAYENNKPLLQQASQAFKDAAFVPEFSSSLRISFLLFCILIFIIIGAGLMFVLAHFIAKFQVSVFNAFSKRHQNYQNNLQEKH